MSSIKTDESNILNLKQLKLTLYAQTNQETNT